MGCQYECSVILMEYNAWIGVIIQCLHHQQDFGRECCATQKWPNFTYSIPFRLRVSPSRSSDVSAALLRHKASMMGDWFVLGLPWWFSGKESTCQCRRGRFDPWVGKIPLRRKWQPTPVFWPGESHGQRSLAGYRPWGRKRVGHNLATKQP